MKSRLGKYLKQASNVARNSTRVRSLLMEAIRKYHNNPRLRTEMDEEFQTLKRMIHAYYNRRYTEIPWKSLVLIIAGLLYFISPLDAIPDFIPLTGFVDDISVLLYVFQTIRTDIHSFREWELNSKNSN